MKPTRADLDERFASPSYFVDPYDVYRQARAEAPIYWSELFHGWVVTKHADVVRTKRDFDTFGNSGRYGKYVDRLPEEVRKEMGPLYEAWDTGIMHADPPHHTFLRNIMMRALTPKMMRAMEERVFELIDEALDEVVPNEPFDFVEAVAGPLPCTIVADLIGVPAETQPTFRKWASDITEFVIRPNVEVAWRTRATILEAKAWLERLMEERRAEPREDLITAFATMEEDGRLMSTADALSNARTIMVAGHGTTTSLLAVGLLSVLERPEVYEAIAEPVRAGDESPLKLAVEEMMRFESPLQRDQRIVRQPVELGGCQMSPGELVFQMLGAAHRDEEVFDRAEDFVHDRNPNKHLAFGYGIHACTGATLARIEARVVFKRLFERFSNVELVEPREAVAWERSVVRLPKRLLVKVS